MEKCSRGGSIERASDLVHNENSWLLQKSARWRISGIGARLRLPRRLREALTKFEQMANWPEIIGCRSFVSHPNTRILPTRTIAGSNTKTRFLTI
jgi:hypothetical protein